jgi:2-polyprenyl-3-methyl-5-hydroxy-6-metoxy-1,4-benzoquinol methylase
MNQAGQTDKARREHWERVWLIGGLPAPFDPASRSLNDHPARVFDRFVSETFERARVPAGASLIELGCGRSVYLPYFARRFGLAVAGIDYSETGCDQARALLARDGVAGDIRHGDIFDPPLDMLARFDVVTSFGLVEHFTDTVDCLRHAAAFAKPGGLVVTTIPNMFGLNGWLTRTFNRPVFDMHVPMTREMLRAAHAAAGLDVIDARYLMSINLNVPHLATTYSPAARQAYARLASWVSKSVWLIERAGVPVRALPPVAPYVAVVARVP